MKIKNVAQTGYGIQEQENKETKQIIKQQEGSVEGDECV